MDYFVQCSTTHLLVVLVISVCITYASYQVIRHPPSVSDNDIPQGLHEGHNCIKTFPDTCNMTWFKRELRLDSDPPVIPRQLLSTCQRVIYNRIPKCASRTFRDVFKVLASQHNLIPIYLTEKWDGLRTPRIRKKYRAKMKWSNDRFLLISHFYFTQFTELYDADTVVYVDITREPVDWFQSLYSWRRYGSLEEPHFITRRTQDNMTQYIRREGGCMDEMSKFGSVNFLCGLAQECFFPYQNTKSVMTALDNVDRHYLTVGMFEDLPAFMDVLEYIMPQVFSNITQVYDQISINTRNYSRTVHKDPMDADSERIVRQQLVHESELYEKLKARFYELVLAVRTLKEAEKKLGKQEPQSNQSPFNTT